LFPRAANSQWGSFSRVRLIFEFSFAVSSFLPR
jgi:hypothetical protein